jgi:hypothetical protein
MTSRTKGRLAALVCVAGALGGGAAAASLAAESGNLFAVVDASGAKLAGGGVSAVQRLGVGRYEVTFNRDVSSCAFQATTRNAFSQALQVFTAGGHGSPAGVYVETKNQGGGLTDGPFHLVVNCGGTGRQLAVVGYSGQLVRGTAGTTVTTLGVGRFNVRFPASVAGCAFLGTVADPGNGLVFNPSIVETGSGPDANTVYVETKNPGGGLSGGVPFHLSSMCSSAPASKIAVVGASGVPVRGSSLTSAFRASTGAYTLVTNRTLSPGCATVLTRGSTNTAVPFTPTTVEVVPGPASNTMGVRVRGLLALGGAPVNESFHAAMVC